MIDLHQITTIDQPYFDEVLQLYTASFPQNERRTNTGLEYELMSEKNFTIHALIRDNEFVGFMNHWVFDEFRYIEHFAISYDLRSLLIGSEAIEIYKKEADRPIILEVEIPTDSQSNRRISFYERLGFSVINQDYAQPPYDGYSDLIPMLIMTDTPHFVNEHFSHIKNTLYTKVYRYNIG